jgi:hypothetical protein
MSGNHRRLPWNDKCSRRDDPQRIPITLLTSLLNSIRTTVETDSVIKKTQAHNHTTIDSTFALTDFELSYFEIGQSEC